MDLQLFLSFAIKLLQKVKISNADFQQRQALIRSGKIAEQSLLIIYLIYLLLSKLSKTYLTPKVCRFPFEMFVILNSGLFYTNNGQCSIPVGVLDF